MQLAFSMADDLFALLERAGEALDYREAWPHLFPATTCSPPLMHALLDDLARNDERFGWESDVLIGLALWRAQQRDLAAVAFTVVDLETTGATPGFAKITEIGAVRLEHGRQVGTFSQLVNPQQTISATITQITGITNAMVRDQPPIAEVLPRFVEFAANSVLVAHNARFDLGFLDYELGLLMRCTFPRPALDTLRLARKLCPGQRCSLSALAERFETTVKPAHRALADALATAELLQVFLAQLEEQGMTTLEQVARFCEPGSRRNYHKITLTEELPTTPGVYIMRDEKGEALYIGKTENLRRRTRDHFLQRQAHGARQALELLDHFEVIECGSEFAALLLEGRLLARYRPQYNQHGTKMGSYHYVKLTTDEYPRVYATPNVRVGSGLYAGPFRKVSLAKKFADCLNATHPLRTCASAIISDGGEGARAATGGDGRQGGGTTTAGSVPGTEQHASRSRHASNQGCSRADIGACLAPCRQPTNGKYAAAVTQVRRVLEGDASDLDVRLQARQSELVKMLAFEQAGKLQEQRETVVEAMRRLDRLRTALTGYAVLAYPARRAGRITLFCVAAGTVVEEIDTDPTGHTREELNAALAAVYAAATPSLPLAAGIIDELLLVHGWLVHHRADVHTLILPPTRPPLSEFAGLVSELTRRLPLCMPGELQQSAAARHLRGESSI
ncbi:MAG: exonuclease domain-containing protein [Thermoleophilia bacterium]